MPPQPAIFLDRDGTVMEETGYCRDPRLVTLIPGAAEALARLRAHGFALVILTNQSGIAHGLLTHEEYHAVHAEMLRQLEKEGGPGLITATYYCPELPPSPRRKPEQGMIEEALREWPLDLTRSWFVGDRASDIECGRRAGVRTILVRTGYGARPESLAAGADFIVKDIVAAAMIVIQNRDA